MTVGVNNVVRVQIRRCGIRRRVLWWIGKNFSDELTVSILVLNLSFSALTTEAKVSMKL